MSERPKLLPPPRSVRLDPEKKVCRLSAGSASASIASAEPDERFALQLLSQTLRGVAASDSGPSPVRIPIEWKRGRVKASASDEAYELSVRSDGITIRARTACSHYYAIQTLRQLIVQYGRDLPCVEIVDAPDFRHRGFLHDVSRGKVPRRKSLFELVELLGSLKYNQLQLYVEHTFAFQRHPLPGRGHSPLTAADLRAVGEHCRKHHIEFVPCLQSFGHAQYFLKHRRYADLAESDFRGGWTLSPAAPGTYQLLEELYEEFLPCFSRGDAFNVCCDETWDLGRGKSAERAEKVGVGQVYVDHVLRVRKLAKAKGRKIQVWGDVIEKHPELVAKLPRDMTMLAWWYEAPMWEKEYETKLKPYRESGRKFWVCPGTSAWNSLYFRRANATANLRQFAEEGQRAGAEGYLVTDWGDNGHYNFRSASLWPLAYGADRAWNAKQVGEGDATFDSRFALQVLADSEGKWIKPLRTLGDLYLRFDFKMPNNSAERWLLTGPPAPKDDAFGMARFLASVAKIAKGNIRAALDDAEAASRALAAIQTPGRALEAIRAETQLSADLTAHACKLALEGTGRGAASKAKALKSERRALAKKFESLWLARNRESDLGRIREDFARVPSMKDFEK